jgi:MFS family permease
MLLCRGTNNLEEHFPHHNWFIVLPLQLLTSITYSIFTPSVHKFITTSTSRPEELKNEQDANRFWPGLGGSDSDYAWVVAIGALLQVLLTPIAAIMSHLLPFSLTILLSLSLYIIGGIVYGLADVVWMVFLGLGLWGAGTAFCSVIIHTYMGEMGTKMDEIRMQQHKRPRKLIVYVAYAFLLNGGYFLSYAITSIMVQFKDLNPYNWPGWCIAALASVEVALVLLFFKELRSTSYIKEKITKCSSFKISLQLKSYRTVQLLVSFRSLVAYIISTVISFILHAGFLSSMSYV